jgi:hypothetical protein
MIKIVRIEQFLMIGEMETDTQTNCLISRGKMKNPRVIQANPQGQLVLAPLVGEPKEMDLALDKIIFAYELEDEFLIKAYRENVTGLILARPANVVEMGRKQ